MKKSVYFSLFIPTIENSNYYSMLYHALETLQLVYKNQYDVVVFYSVPGTALDNHVHLNSFNLVKDFPWVKFIQSDYHVNHSASIFVNATYACSINTFCFSKIRSCKLLHLSNNFLDMIN